MRSSCEISPETCLVWQEVPGGAEVDFLSCLWGRARTGKDGGCQSHDRGHPGVTAAWPLNTIGCCCGSQGSRKSPWGEGPPAPPMVSPESRRPCGLGGGHASGPVAWLLQRGREAWSELGRCQDPVGRWHVPILAPCLTHFLPKG